MRQITAQEKYRAVKEGVLTEGEFVRQMRLAFPQFLSPMSTYPDTVQILKNYDLINEGKEAKEAEELSKYSDDSLRRSIDIELEAMGLMSQETISGEDHAKAKLKAINNLKKDPLHYYNLIAGESSKVDKNDRPKETKRGKLEKDTFNDMKKATLKERKENLVEGTRALVGYLSGDRLTTTYNHYDGYPSHLGKALEMHYNDDDKAKEIAMVGYITGIDGDTGEVQSTHKEKPGKLVLPDDKEQRAREIGEEIDSYGAEYGYVWDDNTNQWITIKNTGIRSMIDQILEKLDMVNVYSGDTMEKIEVDEAHATKKAVLENAVHDIKQVYPELTRDIFKEYINTHYTDLLNDPSINVAEDFMEWAYVNGYMDTRPDDLDEAEPLDTTAAYKNDDDTQAMIDKMRKDGKDADDFVDEEYEPGSIAPEDLYYSDKHGRIVAIDDVDDKYHDSLELVYKKGDKIEGPMDEVLNEGRGDFDIIVRVITDMAQEDGTTPKEAALEVIEAIRDAYIIDAYDEGVVNEEATCCGKCGRVHVKGNCKRPFLKGKSHCRTK
jgi:hypothetical protein